MARRWRSSARRASHLWDALCWAYHVLGFDRVLDGDEVLRDLVLARIVEPTSKIDAERVLTETGVARASYRTVEAAPACDRQTCCPPSIVSGLRRPRRAGSASLVLFDVSTLYFETDVGDGFREPGFSKERVPGTADHPRVAHRRHRFPADGPGV